MSFTNRIPRPVRVPWDVAVCAAATAVLAGGCRADSLTEIVVVTDTDYQVSASAGNSPHLDRVRWEIDASQIDGGMDSREIDLRQDASAAPPFILPLVHRGGPLGPILVTALGTLSSGGTIARSARTSFVRHRSLLLPLPLLRICESVACPAAKTCADGACVPVGLEPTPLDGFARPQGDAGEDFEELDAGLEDSGVTAEAGTTDIANDADGGRRAADSGSVRDATPSVDAETDDGGILLDARVDSGAAPADAGRLDAGRLDAGRPDAGRPDAGRPDAGRLDAGSPDASRRDASSADAGGFDAGSSDAGSFDAGPRCTEQCGEGRCRCECDACTLACRREDCDQIVCRGRDCLVTIEETDDARLVCRGGASCSDVRVRDSEDVRVTCRDPLTTCAVTCENVDNCAVRCSGGASCSLTCRGGSNCEFDRCDGTERACAQGRCCVPSRSGR